MKPEITYSEYLSHNGQDLEVRGEVFDTPIKRSPVRNYHVRISCHDVNTKAPVYIGGAPLEVYFPEKETEQVLKNIVKEFKNNPKFLP